MFGRIAPGYDRANRWLSAGRDVAWRRKAIRDLPQHLRDGRALDVACGTGDLAIDLRRMETVKEIVGVDFCRPMLVAGTDRMNAGKVVHLQADAMQLPFADASFDLITVAYGFRNFDQPDVFLKECRRLLKPEGRVLIVEFFRPGNLWSRTFYATFGRIVFPILGGMLTGDSEAYHYLRTSVQGFLSLTEAQTMAAELDLATERTRSFFGGVSHALQLKPSDCCPQRALTAVDQRN
jgi:ubiquinone/menaquinone biosynthesis methyltransferase